MTAVLLLGVLCLVALTVLGVWYVNRRLKSLEAKVKVEYGLSADRVRDMNRLTGDVNEVRHSVQLLAHEMGLRFERKQTPPQPSVESKTAKQPSVESKPAPPQPYVKSKPAPPQPYVESKQPPPQPPVESKQVKQPTSQPAQVTPQSEPVTPQTAPDAAVKHEALPSPAPQPQPPTPEPPHTQGATQPPSRTAGKGKSGKGKAAGKGKRAIVFDLFPEFIGPTPTSSSTDGVPRVEEVPDDDDDATQCAGGVCPIPAKKSAPQ